ncbi:MAG: molybdate ABC transporter substrate-binding protein [Proteobacteria bacterium]|nr:molybdate ABC transporter substrate-binding protein [Pseudomonadota bacterium]
MARVAGPREIGFCFLKTRGLVLLVLMVLAPLPAMAAEVRLSAAASMSDAVKELIHAFRQENPAIAFLPNFASSGSLAKQIAQGAPADLYISANQKWMEYLVQQQAIEPQTAHVLAYNGLVFVGTNDTKISSLKQITSLSRIAIGSPKSVPAGQYAAQAMRAAGVYEQLAREHKLVMAKDVRQALIYAERGEVDGAFVYRSDALLARHAASLFTVPAILHEPIAYPMGLTPAGAKNPAAQAFLGFLKSSAADKILTRYGFETVRPDRAVSVR